MKTTRIKEMTRRVVALLNREQVEFLNRLSVDAFFSSGYRLTKVDIISALVEAAMHLKLSGMGVKSRDDFARKIISAAIASAERRMYPRLKKSLNVNFRPIESLEDYKDAKTENFSLGGMCFNIPAERVSLLNQPLEIIISDEKGGSMRSIGKVAWVRQSENKQEVKVGVTLTYVRKEDLETFKKYLDE
jgi:hypothetical protein